MLEFIINKIKKKLMYLRILHIQKESHKPPNKEVLLGHENAVHKRISLNDQHA